MRPRSLNRHFDGIRNRGMSHDAAVDLPVHLVSLRLELERDRIPYETSPGPPAST
jgi:hypothetical protein